MGLFTGCRTETGDDARCAANVCLLVVVLITVGVLAVWAAELAETGTAPQLDPGEFGALLRWGALGEMAAAFVGIVLVHRFDRCGTGVRGCYRTSAGLNDPALQTGPRARHDRMKLREAFLERDKGAVRAFVTKQSFSSALALALLGALLGPLSPVGREVDGMHAVLNALAVLAGLLCVVTTLVSIQCYSTFLRYKWVFPQDVDLLMKGRGLDGWSFYLLVAGLLLAIAAEYPLVNLIVTPVFTGLLVHRYYFLATSDQLVDGA